MMHLYAHALLVCEDEMRSEVQESIGERTCKRSERSGDGGAAKDRDIAWHEKDERRTEQLEEDPDTQTIVTCMECRLEACEDCDCFVGNFMQHDSRRCDETGFHEI